MEPLCRQKATAEAASRLSAWPIAAYRRLWFGTVILVLAKQCERLGLGGTNHIWVVFVLVALSGMGQACETPATQGLITETVPPKVAMKAVALWSTGVRFVGALGSLFGGFLIALSGIPVAFFFSSGIFLIGGLVMTTMSPSSVKKPVRDAAGPGILLAAEKGLVLIFKLPVVRTLLLIAFVVETFGFAYQAVLPSFARDVLRVDADGLGILTLAAGCGSVIGVVILAKRGYVSHKGQLLIGVTFGYGLMLIGLGLSGVFPLSLILMMGVGAMAAIFDAMQWTLLQEQVPNDMRGRAIGGWVF